MEKGFSFLDLNFLGNNSGKLEFQVHQNKKQLLKYLNRESTNTKDTFKMTPNEV